MIELVAQAGLSRLVRALIIYISLFLAFVVIAFYAKKTRMDVKRTVAVALLGYVFVVGCALPVAFINGAVSFDSFMTDFLYVPLTMIHSLPFYMLATIPLSIAFKVDFRRLNDFSAVGFILCQGISHFGCIFFGCCHGYRSDFGIYNPLTSDLRFPVQIFDGLSCLLLCFALAFALKRMKYSTGGYLYPVMLIFYGIFRLYFELARDNEKILGPFSLNSMYCFCMIAFGVAYVFVVRALDRRNKGVCSK